MSRTSALPTLPLRARVTRAALREGKWLRVAWHRGSQGVEVTWKGSNEGREGTRRMRARAASEVHQAIRQILQCWRQFHSQNTSDPRTGFPVHLACCPSSIACEADLCNSFREAPK